MEFIQGSHLDDVYYLPEVLEVPTTSQGNGRTSSKGWPCPISMPTGRYDIVSFDMAPGMP